MPISSATHAHNSSARAPSRSPAWVTLTFLKELASWRTRLTDQLRFSNPDLPPTDSRLISQRLLICLTFLRLCETQGAEPDLPLDALRSPAVAPTSTRLAWLFSITHTRYASALFGEMATTYAGLHIPEKLLQQLLDWLYTPRIISLFANLPVDILGLVYEHSLRVDQLEPEQQQHQKAGGVYYTPAPIVQYLLEHTLGALLREHEQEPGFSKQSLMLPLRLLDPSCGGGSFLTRAYALLLAWYREAYLRANCATELIRTAEGEWQLTLAARQRILLTHLYGIDIDPRAVEVTRLSLLLQLRAAPLVNVSDPELLEGLQRNILCGDTLDARNADGSWPGDTNAADFDVVVGNPPYIFGEQRSQQTRDYLRSTYQFATRQYDYYWLFIEQALKLTKETGHFGFIVPDALLARDEARQLRATLLREGLQRVYHCGPIFDAQVSTVAFTLQRGTQPTVIASDVGRDKTLRTEHTCRRDRFLNDPDSRLLIHLSDPEMALLTRIVQVSRPLGDLVRISRGEEQGKKSAPLSGPIPLLAGSDLRRYQIEAPTHFTTTLTKRDALYQAPKIVLVKTGQRCVAALDTHGYATMQSIYNLHLHGPGLTYEALLGLLNSRLIHWFIYKTFTAYKRVFPQLNQTTLKSIPIPLMLERDQAPLLTHVQQRLALASIETEIARQHNSEAVIDQLVYRLYNLSPEEVRLIEHGLEY